MATTDWAYLEQLLDTTADEYQVPRGLARAVVKQESNWDVNAVGDGGRARGWFQLHPGAAIDAKIDPARRHEPEQNILGGVRYLSQKLRQSGGDIDRALLRYNGGGDPNYVQHVRRWLPAGESSLATAQRPPDQRYAAAGDTMTDMPRYQGRGKATEPSPLDQIPLKPPEGYGAAPSATSAAQPEATRSPLDDIPLTPPEGYGATPQRPPTAAPVPQAMPGAAQPPPAAGVSPEAPEAPMQPPQRVVPPEQWAMQQAPAQVTAMGEAGVQDIRPLQPVGAEALEPEVPSGFHVLGTDGRPHPQTKQIAQRLAEQGTPLSGTYHVRGDATPEQLMQNPAAALSPAPTAVNTVRAARDVAQDVGYGAAGAIGGAAVGGVPGMIAGPVIAQGALDRARMQLGLRPQEKAVFETGVVDIYQADLVNAGFSLLLGIPDLARAAITKTSAGKAILAADAEAKTAAEAFQAAETARKEAFDKGQAFNRETFDRRIADAKVKYETKVKERDALIIKHKAEFDQATADYQQQKMQRDAEVQDVDTANYYREQRYQQQVADLPAQQQAADAAAEQKVLDEAAKKEATQQQTYQQKVAQSQADTAAHGEAVERVKMLPEMYKEGGDPYHVKYERATEMARGEYTDPTEARSALKQFREEDYAKLLDDSNAPMPEQVEFYAKQLEKLTEGEPASVQAVWDAMKKLGKLTSAPSGDVRRTASALYGIYSDLLEKTPSIAEAIKDANRTFKRTKAVEEINSWSQGGKGSFVTRDAQNRLVLNQTALFNKLDTLERNKLFRGAFSDEEWAALRKDVGEFANTPALGKDVPRPEPVPLGEPAYKTLPEPTREPVLGYPKELGPEPTLKQEKPLAPFPTTTFEETTAGRRTFEPGKPPPTQEEARAAATLGPPPRMRETVGGLSQVGGVAYLLQRAGLTPGGVDKLIWGTIIGVGAKMLTKKAEYHILSKALMSQDGRKLLKASMDSKGIIDPNFYGAFLSTLSMPERKAIQRDLPTEPEPEKGGRRGASR